MPRRWLVNTSNNRLVGVIDDDDAAVPAGRSAVAQSVIRATGVARADIKTNGTWVITNGVGAYTAPVVTTLQVRDRRRVTLARNIIKNWLPAANGLLAIADAAVNLRLGVQIDAMVRCITSNASVDGHYVTSLLPESLVNGFDFVLYAGPQWDNSTDGYYRELSGGGGSNNHYPEGSWTFHTINQNLAGSPSEGNTGGTNHPNVTTDISGASTFNWMRELWKMANP